MEEHLGALRLPFTREVRLPGETLRAVQAELTPDDPRCGVLTHDFRYGGSVPEGWATSTTLVLLDAAIEIVEYDGQPSTSLSVRAASEERVDAIERMLVAAARRSVEAHLRGLTLTARCKVALPGNGGTVHQRLREQLLPEGDPRCGVLSHSFQYGGSVPEGTAERTTLVLVDAMIQTEDFDYETNTFVEVSATTRRRADELAERVERVAKSR